MTATTQLTAFDDESRDSSSRNESAAVRALLDDAHSRLNAADVSMMDTFADELARIRNRCAKEAWRQLVDQIIAVHPVCGRIREEPLTRRAFEKPKGYAGDASMLDFMYGESGLEGPLTPLGAQLTRWIGRRPAAQSVRERRRILSELIDSVGIPRPDARVLSIACGHLREAQTSAVVRSGKIAEFVALDQDADSIALIAREQREFSITPIRATIRRLLVAPLTYGTFDLVYSAGLYNYLDDEVAQALTLSMFDALRPGGTLVVANFAPELRDIGFMEAIMDWNLILRDEVAVSRFTTLIDESAIAEQSMRRDSIGNVIYLTVRKAG